MPLTRIVAATAISIALTAACAQGPNAGGAPPVFPPATVVLDTVKASPIDQATEYVATLKSLRSTAVQPQTDGQITQILVKSGDRVGQGTRLIQIDSSRQSAAVSSQEAERAAREADVNFARQQLQRANELFTAGAISKQELEQAEVTVRTAEARLQALQAQVRQEQVQLRYFTVTAPTAGIVGDIPVRVGNHVSPQTVLTTIDQNDTLELYVQVPVERSGALKVGLPIRITTDDGAPITETTASFISSHVDDDTQTILVKAQLRNPEGRLRASQFVRAQIVWSTSEGVVLPVTAAVRINGQHFAFIAEQAQGPDGKPALVARQRAEKVGPIIGEHYPVLEGLKLGDRVVISGAQKLMDGAPIAPTS
jgi:RND family efflux transporter MFP subunit